MMTDCIFCSIVSGDIPSHTVYEDENTIAFLDIYPAAPVHVLVVPKVHNKNIFDISEETISKSYVAAKHVAGIIKEKLGNGSVNIIQSNGKDAGQEVFHFHIHVIPREQNDNLVKFWEPKAVNEEELKEVLIRLTGSE